MHNFFVLHDVDLLDQLGRILSDTLVNEAHYKFFECALIVRRMTMCTTAFVAQPLGRPLPPPSGTSRHGTTRHGTSRLPVKRAMTKAYSI